MIKYLYKLFACTAPRGNPEVNYRHWVMMMCQIKFIFGIKKKKYHSVSDADYEGGSAYVGVVAKWEVSVLSCHFYSTYLTALKKKVLKKKKKKEQQLPEMNRDRCQKQGEMKRLRIENFQGTEITLYNITMFSYTFQKPWNVQFQVKVKSVSCSAMPPFLGPRGLYVAQQSPLSMDSPGNNTGVDCHFLLRGSSQPGFEPGSPELQVDSLPSEPSRNESLI